MPRFFQPWCAIALVVAASVVAGDVVTGCSAEHPPPPTDAPPTISVARASSVAPPASAELPSGSESAADGPSSSAMIPSAPAAKKPYPEASIVKALSVNDDRSCRKLVYKNGCAQLRTGTIKLLVVLGPDGRVERFDVLENAIRRDAPFVEACVRENLPKWTFDPPGEDSGRFEMTLIFSDKC